MNLHPSFSNIFNPDQVGYLLALSTEAARRNTERYAPRIHADYDMAIARCAVNLKPGAERYAYSAASYLQLFLSSQNAVFAKESDSQPMCIRASSEFIEALIDKMGRLLFDCIGAFPTVETTLEQLKADVRNFINKMMSIGFSLYEAKVAA